MSTSTDKPVDATRHVLVAGCGYLGQRAARRWMEQGIAVTAITRTSARAAELSSDGIDTVVGDLATGQLPSLPPVDTVLWSVGFDRGSGQSREAIWIDGLKCLLLQLPSSARRFLYVSSTGVYGQTNGETVSESTKPQPNTDSGECCLQAERLLHDAFSQAADAPAITVFRMAGLYGPGRLLRRVSDLRAGVPLSGSEGNWLNLIHIDDAVTALMEIEPRRDIPLINVVNTETLTRGEYYRELARLADAPVPVFVPNKATSRGGNKRVVSSLRGELALSYLYDDVRTGLAHAAGA